MSNPGYFYEPQDAEQAETFRRKRAYADALLRDREPQGQFGGLAGAGQKIAAALLAKNADKGARELAQSSADRYAQAMTQFYGGGQLPQASAAPQQFDENGGAMPAAPQPAAPAMDENGAPIAPGAQIGAAMGGGSQMERLLATKNGALIRQLAPALFENQMGRDNKLWEHGLGMSQADKEKSADSQERAEALAKFQNNLPMTAREKAMLGIQQQQIGLSQAQLALAQNEARQPKQYMPGSILRSPDGKLTQLPLSIDGQQKQADRLKANTEAATDFDTALGTLDTMMSGGGMSGAVGANLPFVDGVPFMGAYPGSKRADFEANLETFQAQTFLPMVKKLVGMGALSDAEGKKLAAAVGALNPKMSEDAFKKSAGDIWARLSAARNRIPGVKPKEYGVAPWMRPADKNESPGWAIAPVGGS